MMRITGGLLGGRLIKAPGGPVRPTQERVREALFSIIGDRIVGCRFLDLFAGSGAVGIEAWSRGAAFVCWVEQQPRVCAVLEQNVRELCDARTRILRWNVEPLLKKGLEEPPFDIIFADPPYRQEFQKPRRDREPVRPERQGRRENEAEVEEWDEETAPRRRLERSGAGPPKEGWTRRLTRLLDSSPMLAAGGLLILELSAREAVARESGWLAMSEKVYGDTRLRILCKES